MVKKIISLFLAISMSASLFVLPTGAEDSSVTITDDFEDAIITVQKGGWTGTEYNNRYDSGPIINAAKASYQFRINNRGVGDEEALRMDCGFSIIANSYENYSVMDIYKEKIVLGDDENNFVAYETNTFTGEGESIYQIYETINGTRDWTYTMQYTELKSDANSASFNVYLQPDCDQDTAWVDNVTLYKVAFDPFLRAILETPTYHGADDKTVPVQESISMVDAVKNAGGDAKLTILENTGHNSWDYAYGNKELFDWMLSKKKTGTHAVGDNEYTDSKLFG